MRIVYVLTSLGMGGAERQALALAERMARRGHTVAVLVLSARHADEWPTELDIIRLEMSKRPLPALAGLLRARGFLVEFRADLLHSHSFHANLVARLLKVLVPGITVVSTVHNVYEGGRLRMLAYRATGGLSCLTTAVSQAVADRFVRLKAVSERKSMAVSNGINTVEFAPCAERRARIRRSMCAEGEFVWLAAGRIAPAKDYPNLLRAFAQVRASHSEARLWIAGGEVSAATAAAVHDVAVELLLEDKVRWLGTRRDLPDLLDAADAFVLSSAWEGMPLAVGEAMAMEKPVVATDAGGVRELMGEAGWVVPPGNANALAAAMVECMRSAPEERMALGSAARERVQSKFNIDMKADEWEMIYHNVTKK
jgi:glycosyltransferase involved in cell wall biosynthesis